MNSRTTLAVILIAVGIVILAYSGITFKTKGKPHDVLGVTVQKTHKHHIPPVAGGLALIGGIVLLIANPKRV
jgi:hypothetical protein